MKRILALHGFGQNAKVLKQKLAKIQEACTDTCEFVIPNALHILDPVDMPDQERSNTAYCPGKPEDLPRTWYKCLYHMSDEWRMVASAKYLREILETQGPFDGIFGFSQGGAVASLLTASLEHPERTVYFKGIKHPPFQFCISVAGYPLPGLDPVPSHPFFMPFHVTTPSILINGYNDARTIPEWAELLRAKFDNAHFEWHEGGHFIPCKRRWMTFFIERLHAFCAASPSKVESEDLGDQFTMPWSPLSGADSLVSVDDNESESSSDWFVSEPATPADEAPTPYEGPKTEYPGKSNLVAADVLDGARDDAKYSDYIWSILEL